MRHTFQPRVHAWLAYLVAGLIAMFAFALLPRGSRAQDVVYDGVSISAAIVILLGVRLHRPANHYPWLLIAAGQFAFFVGDLLWVIYAEMGQSPFPSLADVFYLGGYPFIAAGLALGIRRRLTGGDRSGLLDASILVTSAAVLAWTFQIGPLVSGLDPDPLAFGISLAYPLMDLLVIGVGIGLLATPGARTTSFRFVAISLVTLLIADQIYALQTAEGSYENGGLLDLAWMVGYLTWGAAALHPSMRAVFDPRPVAVTLLGPLRLAFLGAAMLTGPVLLAFGRPDPDLGVIVIAGGTAILSLLVLIRLAGLVRLLSADIAKRRVLEEELSFQATHDPLTHLTNRRLFVQRVDQALDAGGEVPDVAVLFLDLDDFKTVNDSLGHAAGDALLIAVAGRIRSCLRERDVAARLGGDEFAVLLRETSTAVEAEAAAGRLAMALSVPIALEGTVVPVAASIGIALPTAQITHVDDLLRAADIAMYGAKARGKDRSQVYSPALDQTDVIGIGEPARFRQPTIERGRSAMSPPTGLRPEGA